MAYYSRFSPFLKPYLPQMVGAAVLVMAVALVNLLLVRLAGFLWDIITVQHDVRVVQSTVTETPIDSAKQLVTLVGGVAFLLVMNWRLCLLILMLLPLLVLVARMFGQRLRSLSTAIQDQTASTTTLVEEVLAGIRVV